MKKNTDVHEHIYNIDELAEKLKSTPDYLNRQIRQGRLKAFKRLNKWFVLHSDLVVWIANGKLSLTNAEDELKVVEVYENEKGVVFFKNDEGMTKKELDALRDEFMRLRDKAQETDEGKKLFFVVD